MPRERNTSGIARDIYRLTKDPQDDEVFFAVSVHFFTRVCFIELF